MLKGKTVVVGVCGGIAAYKVVELVSKLKKLNAEVYTIMTESATKFVTPLTFQSISHNPVVTDMFEKPGDWEIKHIALAFKADLFVIAPATANIIGKIANGIADDMLTTTVIAAKVPVLFAPAMNTNMYENPIVQANISKLKSFGYLFIEADIGSMACGTVGKGRLPEPSEIVNNITGLLSTEDGHSHHKDAYPQDMCGIRVMITAGPTHEAIDPVRYISNHSSGKMGYAVAEAAALRGAEVSLISGPVFIEPPHNVNVFKVTSADEMYNKVMKQYSENEILIMIAAVADYKSAFISDKKIKKANEDLNLKLEKNRDIAKELGMIKGERILIGTCAETNDLLANAESKLEEKNFDMIVANDVTMEGAGFEIDTNIIKIIKRDGTIIDFPIMSKKELGHRILDEALKLYKSGELN